MPGVTERYLLFIIYCVATGISFVACHTGYDCVDGPSRLYVGNVNKTASGRTCQRWDVDLPHKPKHLPLDGPHHNYCRNPDNDLRGTWCYTTENITRWEYCNITKCPDDSLVIWTSVSSTQRTYLIKSHADPEVVQQDTSANGIFSGSILTESNLTTSEYWALAAHYRKKLLYFSDYRAQYVAVWDMNKNEMTKYFEGMAHGIESLAIDWKTNNLYWTDSALKWVMAADDTFTYYTPVYRTAPDPTYGLAIHSVKRYLIFTTYKTLGSKIIMTDLAGKNENVLFEFPSINDVTGLAIDYTDDRLYWTNFNGYGGMIVSSRMDGTNRTQHNFRRGSIYWGVAPYTDYLYVSDIYARQSPSGYRQHTVWVLRKLSNQVYRYTLGDKPRGIAVYSHNEDYTIDTSSNIGECNSDFECDHICLPSINTARTCACSLGYHLDTNTTKCIPQLVKDDFLLVVDEGQGKVFQIPFVTEKNDKNATKYSIVPIGGKWKVSTVAVDPNQRYMYWSDRMKSSVGRSFLDGGRYVKVASTYANSIIVDPHTGLIFYSDNEKDTIMIAHGDGNYAKTIVKPDPALNELSSIKMIVQDITYKYIYWTDTFSKADQGKVMRCRHDGSEKEVVLDRLNRPHAITIDYKTNRLYVGADAWIYEIELSSLRTISNTSAKQQTIKKYDMSTHGYGRTQHIIDLKIHLDMAYVVHDKSRGLQRFNLSEGVTSMSAVGPVEFFKLTTVSVFSETFYSAYIKPVRNPCATSECRHICIALSDTISKCICADGHQQLGTNCIRDATLDAEDLENITRMTTSPAPTTHEAEGRYGTTAKLTYPFTISTGTDLGNRTTRVATSAAPTTHEVKGRYGTTARLTYPAAMDKEPKCMDSLLTYYGTMNTTISGRTCQQWNVDKPHKPKHRPVDTSDHNYCRNPDNDSTGPWCYTTDLYTRWEYCDIILCDHENITRMTTSAPPTTHRAEGRYGTTAKLNFPTTISTVTECTESLLTYNGTMNTTISGRACQRWNVDKPHKPRYRPVDTSDHNYCRNVDNDLTGPWCYTTDQYTRWEYCNIQLCDLENTTRMTTRSAPTTHEAEGRYETTATSTYQTTNSPETECTESLLTYNGSMNTTISGRTCQRWNVDKPHKPRYRPVDTSDHNYCRNADNDPTGPWCYTTDRYTRWEYCNIILCEPGNETTALPYRTASEALHAPHTEAKVQTSFSAVQRSTGGEPAAPETTAQPYRTASETSYASQTEAKIQTTFAPIPSSTEKDLGNRITTTRSAAPTTHDVKGRYGTTARLTYPTTMYEDIAECTESLLAYNGTMNTTISGKSCQRWNVDKPHKPKHRPVDTSDHNYCRNPDNDSTGPWCYTTDLYTRWEYCDIILCDLENTTRLVTSASPTTHQDDGRYGTTAELIFPTTISSVTECTESLLTYNGTMNTTISGKTCQRWNVDNPHKPKHRPVDISDHNYCRNADNDPTGPWCYTTDQYTRWEYCNIILCEPGNETTTLPYRTASESLHAPYTEAKVHTSFPTGQRSTEREPAVPETPAQPYRTASGTSYSSQSEAKPQTTLAHVRTSSGKATSNTDAYHETFTVRSGVLASGIAAGTKTTAFITEASKSEGNNIAKGIWAYILRIMKLCKPTNEGSPCFYD